jgi:hypothetical protein
MIWLETAWKVALVIQLLLLLGCEGKVSLQWRHCNGCGKNTPQESRGCDLGYDLGEHASGDSTASERTVVYPGEAFDVPVVELMDRLVPRSWFESNIAHCFDWKKNGIMYYTVGILQPTYSRVLEPVPVERIMMYQEIKAAELDGGVLHSYVPALDYSNEQFGGPERTIQISVNVNPGNLMGTFPVNYYSLESDNRAFLCADIKVDSEADAWTRSDLYEWKTGPWKGCVHEATGGACPYDSSEDSGIQERDVWCYHPATVLGSETYVRGYDGEKGKRTDVVPEMRCSGSPKPATTMRCTPPSCAGGDWSSKFKGINDGDSVVLPSGMSGDLVLDVSTPNLHILEVRSTLRVKDGTDLKITADSIRVNGGELVAGDSDAPWLGDKLEIILTSSYGEGIYSRSVDTGPRSIGVENKALIVSKGGSLKLYGRPGVSWTRLTEVANAGAKTIFVESTDPLSWQPGDEIVVTNSDFHDISSVYNGEDEYYLMSSMKNSMSERRVIAKVSRSGNQFKIDLDAPLSYGHYGASKPEDIGGRLVDQRAEVLWLSRNIQIRGQMPLSVSDLDGFPNFSSNKQLYDQSRVDPVYGGHVMIMPDARRVELKNVEFAVLGQAGRLARYPLHFHRMKGKGTSCFVDSCAIHDTFQRSITIHDTQGLSLHNTASYNARGHALFWEDGTEVLGDIKNNIVVATQPQLVQDWREDFHDDLPSAFWITNFNNKFEGNVAADTNRGVGFWVKMDSHSEGELLSHPQAVASSLMSFKDNTAHSNHFSGIWIWHDWYPCAPFMNTYHYLKDGPKNFTIFGSTSSDLRMDSDVEYEDGRPAGGFGVLPRNDIDFGGDRCSTQPVQVLKNTLTFKHRDVGTAVYLSSTNIEFQEFTSVSDSVAMSFAQIYRDQTGPNGLSQFDRQMITGLTVATSKSHKNTINKNLWCSEMKARGVPGLKAGSCSSECHPWPETSHPSGFPDDLYEIATSNNRYLSGVTLSNEGQVGAQEVQDLTLVDWVPDPACGIVDVQGVHVKPGIGIEFPIGARQVKNVRVLRDGADVTKSTPLGHIVRLHGEQNYGNHETLFLYSSALGDMSSKFPSGAYAIVPSGDDDLFIIDENEGPNGVGCLDQRVHSGRDYDMIDAILCDARDLWMTTIAVDFSKTNLYTSGDGPGELQCTPSVLLLDYAARDEFERTYAGVGFMDDAGIGRPSESDDFYRYRYIFKVAVGKMYLVDFGIENFDDCAGQYMADDKPTFITMEKMDYNSSDNTPRTVDLVLSIPAKYRPLIEWYADTTGGDYGKLGSGTRVYVPLPSKSNLKYIPDAFYEEDCCNNKLFIHVRLGERINGQDSAIKTTWEKNDNDGCSKPCASPWPFASDFQDTSALKATRNLKS